jgi:sugar phosphate isomerase/epimerase
MDRRSFQKIGMLATFAALQRPVWAKDADKRKFTIDLCPGTIGVSVDQTQAIELAGKYKFESVQPYAETIGALDAAGRDKYNALLKSNKLVWGASGLPVEFRATQQIFDSDLKKLPMIAAGLQHAGVTRIGTWLSPCSDELTYMANFRQHVQRISAIAGILGDHNIRFGLEYVGPKTLWASKKHAFIHTLNETLELIAETGKSNLGIVLDSWHWYTAHEDRATLDKLTNAQIVAVDLNDAPKGLEIDQQLDNKRELPAATGVIDVKAFLQYLVDVGYDGPVRAEPFNKPLNDMDNEAAVEATSIAMHKAVATLES